MTYVIVKTVVTYLFDDSKQNAGDFSWSKRYHFQGKEAFVLSTGRIQNFQKDDFNLEELTNPDVALKGLPMCGVG